MKSLVQACRIYRVGLAAIVSLMSLYPLTVHAQTPLVLRDFEGSVQVQVGETVPFTLKGDAPVIGKFNAMGEILFAPGQTAGSLIGLGVIACKTPEGDVLVGQVRWDLSSMNAEHRLVAMQFNWKANVKTSNGTTLSSTGRFAHSRPGDMTAQGIIAILIGLLVPVGS